MQYAVVIIISCSLSQHKCLNHAQFSVPNGFTAEPTWFIRRSYVKLFVASNAIQTIDNKKSYLIIYCLNCI